VERVVDVMNDRLDYHFELHHYDEDIPRVLIRTVPLASTSEAEVAQEFSNKLRVSPNFIWADGVARGLYAKIECEFIEKPAINTKKIIKLFKH